MSAGSSLRIRNLCQKRLGVLKYLEPLTEELTVSASVQILATSITSSLPWKANAMDRDSSKITLNHTTV